MRTLVLWLSLVPSLAVAAPATVLDHRVRVTVDSSRRLKEAVTWTVRIDDPAGCTAGVLAPPGLDGAMDGGAMVLEELLVVPGDVAAGTTYTLTATRTADRGAHSGVLLSAPDLPTEHAEIVVEAPSSVPLTVWADPGALPTFEVRGLRRVTMTWDDLAPGASAQAAWSTYADWFEAAQTLSTAVDRKLADKKGMGRDLAADLEGLGIAGIAEKAFDAITLEEGPPGTWGDARDAVDVIAARSGSAVDRGVVLLSMLRASGMDAVPGYYRPASALGSFPITVPAPRLLPRPVVVVRKDGETIWVDPAADRAAIPDLPASMLGATVWVPGDLPARLVEKGVFDGAVAINTALTLSGDGTAQWSVSVQATGAAQEYLRNLLAPLDDAGRTEALSRLLRQARPTIERVTASVTGADRATKKLKITVNGFDNNASETMGYGLRSKVAPTLAPALAAWLPPRISIVETVAITPPPAVQILGSALDPGAYRPEATVSRTLTRQGPKAVLTTSVERPYRRSTPATDAAAASFAAEQAPLGVELLMFTAASSTAVKGLRATPTLSAADKAVLEAMLWWSNDNDRKAVKTLEKAAPVVGFEPLLAGLERYSDPADLRPWMGLAEVAALDDARRILVVEALERAGARRQAWMLAAGLRNSADPDARLRGLLAMERLQGPKPDPEIDPEGAAVWAEPISLIVEAQKAAKEIPGLPPTGDPRVVFRLAELSLAQGDRAGAETLLEGLREGERAGLAEVMLALAAAQGGVPIDEVRERVHAAIEKSPFDAAVLAIAAQAVAQVGDRRTALEYALTAARLANDDPGRWSDVVPHALAVGDLPTAVDAARRASDLDPQSPARAERWATLAGLQLDKEQVDAARVRAGLPAIASLPTSVDDRMNVDPDALLAVLQSADTAVAGEPRLLAMRAQMRIETGLLDDGARDGLLLATRHGRTDGAALAFAATAGRQYSTSAIAALDAAAKTEITAQMTRMEYRLISGTADPLEDARRLGDDPRAAALVRTASKPAEVIAELEGWPEKIPAPTEKPPAGYRANRALSGVPGVTGASNAEAAVAIVRVGSITGLLPPPIGLLYTAHPQPVERLDDGGQVLRLDGGIIPLYAATTVAGTQEIYGLGFTVEGAKLALRDALGR